jgi:hypothetical protein
VISVSKYRVESSFNIFSHCSSLPPDWEIFGGFKKLAYATYAIMNLSRVKDLHSFFASIPSAKFRSLTVEEYNELYYTYRTSKVHNNKADIRTVQL